jgi:hypothetical protein
MRMRVSYRDCHEDGLCCYLVIHTETYYVHYSCFTRISICDLFTDSPSRFKQFVTISRILTFIQTGEYILRLLAK